MPSIIDRLRGFVGGLAKSFRLGAGVVSPWDAGHGVYRGDYFTGESDLVDYASKSVAVYACIDIRAQAIASLDVTVYKGKGKEREVVTDHPAVQLLERVNPYWSRERLMMMTEATLCTEGECFWVIERGPTGMGKPTEIWWVPPGAMRPVPHPEDYLAGFIYEQNGTTLAFKPSEVVWLRGWNIADEFRPLSPLSAARLSIDTGLGAVKSNKTIFDRGYQIAGIVTPVDKDQNWKQGDVETLESLLQRRFSGADKAHRLAVLSHAIDVKQVSLTPKDAEFLGMMTWSLNDVCRVYRVPPPMVQDFERSTYNNVEQAYKAFWGLCIKPQAAMIAADLREQFLPMFGAGQGLTIEFDFDDVEALKEDQGEIVDQMVALVGMGVPVARVLGKYMPDLLPEEGEEPDEYGPAILPAPAGEEGPRKPADVSEDPDEETEAAKAAQRILRVLDGMAGSPVGKLRAGGRRR